MCNWGDTKISWTSGIHLKLSQLWSLNFMDHWYVQCSKLSKAEPTSLSLKVLSEATIPPALAVPTECFLWVNYKDCSDTMCYHFSPPIHLYFTLIWLFEVQGKAIYYGESTTKWHPQFGTQWPQTSHCVKVPQEGRIRDCLFHVTATLWLAGPQPEPKVFNQRAAPMSFKVELEEPQLRGMKPVKLFLIHLDPGTW